MFPMLSPKKSFALPFTSLLAGRQFYCEGYKQVSKHTPYKQFIYPRKKHKPNPQPTFLAHSTIDSCQSQRNSDIVTASLKKYKEKHTKNTLSQINQNKSIFIDFKTIMSQRKNNHKRNINSLNNQSKKVQCKKNKKSLDEEIFNIVPSLKELSKEQYQQVRELLPKYNVENYLKQILNSKITPNLMDFVEKYLNNNGLYFQIEKLRLPKNQGKQVIQNWLHANKFVNQNKVYFSNLRLYPKRSQLFYLCISSLLLRTYKVSPLDLAYQLLMDE